MTNETNKTLTITPPEGYEIDEDNSTFQCIKIQMPTYRSIKTSKRVVLI